MKGAEAFRVALVTAGSDEEAAKIARALVEERLAACANVLDGMTSIYRWQGAVCEDSEAVLIAKTSQARVAALTERVKALHSYDCPCVVTLPVAGGNTDFLDWIAAQTEP
ncbi:MAG: divalent-cation tolerance protein CutA, partial [Nitrospinota bacterium]|nr:divalent-cation tolerance protein CutA [Nitrospinota bacterium]